MENDCLCQPFPSPLNSSPACLFYKSRKEILFPRQRLILKLKAFLASSQVRACELYLGQLVAHSHNRWFKAHFGPELYLFIVAESFQ